MPTKQLTSREFNRNTGHAKTAANNGPAYITDRGPASSEIATPAEFD